MRYNGKEYKLVDGEDRLFNLSFKIRQIPSVEQLIGYCERLQSDPTTPDYLDFMDYWDVAKTQLHINEGIVGSILIEVPGVKIEVPVDVLLDTGGLTYVNDKEVWDGFTDEENDLIETLEEEFYNFIGGYEKVCKKMELLHNALCYVTPEQAMHNLSLYRQHIEISQPDYEAYSNGLQTAEDTHSID